MTSQTAPGNQGFQSNQGANFGNMMHYSERNLDLQSQISNTSRYNQGRMASPFHNKNPHQMRATGGSQYGGASSYAPSMVHAGASPCPSHPEEYVSYFCFSCLCPAVCAECVIHGEHQGHDVQTIRKAMPEIHEHFEALVHSVS
jgi:hypothetical protein